MKALSHYHDKASRGSFYPTVLYSLVVLFSVLFSFGGIWLSVHMGCPSAGGRGGALAVAVAFLVLFLRRDYGLMAYKIRTHKIPELLRQTQMFLGTQAAASGEKTDLSNEIQGILDYLMVNSSGQTFQNLALALASVIGTIAWGFGDIAANWLQTHSLGWCVH